jgi:ABC-type multidrug transport system permease subunit
VMIGLGLLVGFRFHSSAPRVFAGMALILAFGYAFSWMYTAIGLATKDPETAQVAGILPFFILMFASNAIVPVATMPGWAAGLSPAISRSASPSRQSVRSWRAARPRSGSGSRPRGLRASSRSSSRSRFLLYRNATA